MRKNRSLQLKIIIVLIEIRLHRKSNQFQMEQTKMCFTLLLLALAVVTRADNYFTGLNIDAQLLCNTNDAINDLEKTLNANMNCEPEPVRSSWAGNLRGFRFLEQRYSHFQFKGIRGFDGYNGGRPNMVCQYSQRNGMALSIYQKIVNVVALLQKVRNYLIQYNNIIIGSGNAVTGSNNLVIGSRNSFTGSNYWVFASDYESSSTQNGVLIIQDYLIQLADINLIPTNPQEAIHCIEKQESNRHFNNFWTRSTTNRRFSF